MGILHNQVTDLATPIIQGKCAQLTLSSYDRISLDAHHYNPIGREFHPRYIVLCNFLLSPVVLSSTWKLSNWRWRPVGNRISDDSNVIFFTVIFRLIPYSLGGALMSVVSGIVLSRVGRYRLMICFSWAIATVGYGLMTMLNNNSSKCVCIS
jgi:hypothetical protein